MWYKGGLDCLWVTCRIVIVHKLRKHGLHSCANALDIIISENCVRVNYNRIMTVFCGVRYLTLTVRIITTELN
jgi:hypothetical protein